MLAVSCSLRPLFTERFAQLFNSGLSIDLFTEFLWKRHNQKEKRLLDRSRWFSVFLDSEPTFAMFFYQRICMLDKVLIVHISLWSYNLI